MRSRVLRINAGDGSSLTVDKGDEPVPLRWHAVLASPGLTATAELDNDPILFSQPMLRDYFAELAADWRGWTGTRSWRAGALAFDAEHDGLAMFDRLSNSSGTFTTPGRPAFLFLSMQDHWTTSLARYRASSKVWNSAATSGRPKPRMSRFED